jgi:hypothetical protein
VFPDAEIPLGAGMPVTRTGLRQRVLRVIGELMDEREIK